MVDHMTERAAYTDEANNRFIVCQYWYVTPERDEFDKKGKIIRFPPHRKYRFSITKTSPSILIYCKNQAKCINTGAQNAAFSFLRNVKQGGKYAYINY